MNWIGQYEKIGMVVPLLGFLAVGDPVPGCGAQGGARAANVRVAMASNDSPWRRKPLCPVPSSAVMMQGSPPKWTGRLIEVADVGTFASER